MLKAIKPSKVIIDPTLDEKQIHPFIEKKVKEANQILRKVGLPKGHN